MERKLFGTDGMRGTANTYPMTAEVALRLATAAGRYFRQDKKMSHKVVTVSYTHLRAHET